MKIYIVTSGKYSDYRIKRVFRHKEKAERYLSLCDTYFNESVIEEYETCDDTEFDELRYLTFHYDINEGKENIELRVRASNTLDDSEDKIYFSSQYNWNGHQHITLHRVINSNNIDETYLKEKYKKICQGLLAEIKALREIEGWDHIMVEEWLKKNVDKYVPLSE